MPSQPPDSCHRSTAKWPDPAVCSCNECAGCKSSSQVFEQTMFFGYCSFSCHWIPIFLVTCCPCSCNQCRLNSYRQLLQGHACHHWGCNQSGTNPWSCLLIHRAQQCCQDETTQGKWHSTYSVPANSLHAAWCQNSLCQIWSSHSCRFLVWSSTLVAADSMVSSKW